MDLSQYILERLSRPDQGNNKGYRGHTLVIQETFFNSPLNIKNFAETVNEVGYVDLTNKMTDGKYKGMPNTESYSKVCLSVSSEVNYTLLKNIVPAAHRMGLIDLDKKGRENTGFKLSKLGQSLVGNNDRYENYKICDILSRNTFSFYKNENGFDFLSLVEMFLEDYEFSSLDFNEVFILIDDQISIEDKKDLILTYKRMTNTPIKRMKYDNLLSSSFNDFNVSNKSKLEKRDYGNVKNQISRIMEKLNLMIIFAYNPMNMTLTMKNKFGSTTVKYRSGTDIREAKECNSVTIPGLDGHHIVPHDFITTMSGIDRKLIENKDNIIFLSKEDHQKFPNKNNPYIDLSFDSSSIIFSSIYNKSDSISLSMDTFNIINNNGDIEKNHALLKNMVSHNKKTIKYLFDVKILKAF